MCGITGWVDWTLDLTKFPTVLEQMTQTLAPRGPDATGAWLSPSCALGHRRLSVMDPENGAQPMSRLVGDFVYTIVYNGELYNAPELKRELQQRGYAFRTQCDTEVLLVAFIEWGPSCLDRLNGIFAFAVWSEQDESLFLARDRLGVKPLFYALQDGRLLFGSEPKAILAHPEVNVEVDCEGLAEVFTLGPARTPGVGVYFGIAELKPGHYMTYNRGGARIGAYWRLISAEHEHNEEETARKVRELLQDALERQLASDVPICTLLSGGLDSSALTSLAVDYYKRTGQGTIHTFSVDYVDNDKHFKSSAFQPNADAPWIKRMADYLGTEHHSIEFDTPDLIDSLRASLFARDLPGMADIDGSLYLFCREIKKTATVAVSGEAADEIFGGYPWFHREDALHANTFPWSLQVAQRNEVLSSELLDWVKPQQYVERRYAEAIAEVPHLEGETSAQRNMRTMSYLNITRFMPTLLDRKDRMSMAAGLEVRVPFCDHRLIEYVWNIPWAIKMAGDREKGILRKALTGALPDDVLYRKKSPYPKTHNPAYLDTVKSMLLDLLDDSASPLPRLLNVPRVRQMVAEATPSHHFPWFGQLMSTPQLFAFLIQVDTWLRSYKVNIKG